MPVFVVGDVHGHADRLASLLRDAGLLDERLRWAGADARLWFLGDLVDRGPDGIGAVDLVMRLEREAPVRCLLGNHEAAILAAYRFPFREFGAWQTFRSAWEANGGVPTDLERLTAEHLAWIERLPAVARDGDWLLLHSDTDRYLDYGNSVGDVRTAISSVVAGADPGALVRLLDVLADRGALASPGRVRRLLGRLGGERVVHGHTPIALALGQEPATVTGPLLYAEGLVLDVDHCLYAGGPGFVTELR